MTNKIIITLFCIILIPELNAQEPGWFTDITQEAGLTGIKSTYVQSADVNGDDYPDILVGTSGINPGHSNTFTFYLNVEDEITGSRKFVDFTQESGINVSRIAGKPLREYDLAILFDVDNDGDVDLVTAMYYHRLEYVKDPDSMDKPDVFINDGTGHFTVKEDNGLNDNEYYPGLYPGFVDAVGLSAIDYDYDGDLDLYIATKFKDYKYNVMFPDILMENNGDGTFQEAELAGVQDITEPLYGLNVTDYNNDGWQDVITSPYCRSGGRILENTGEKFFTDVAQEVNYNAQEWGGDWYYNTDYSSWMQQPLCQWEAPTADYDNDGDMDILQCLIHGGYEERDGKREGHTHIATNQGPPNYNFISDLDQIHRRAKANTHLGDYGGLWVDFENNGWLDIVICEGYYFPASDRVYMCVQKDDHEFYDVTEELDLMYIKDASNAQASDFDLDGDNDIFVFHNGDNGSQLRLLRNDIANESNWVSVKLVPPTGTNKNSIGARITVCSDTISQIREIQTGLGHFGGQEPFIRNFGLGDINGIDSIKVRWPKSNTPVTTVYNPPMNLNLIIDSSGYSNYIKTWQGDKPIVKFETSRTNLGLHAVGTSVDTTITVMNIGETDLNCSIYLKGDTNVYQILDDIQNISLAPNESQTVNIRFSPELRLNYHSVLVVESDAGNGEVVGYDIKGQGFKEEAMISSSLNSIEYDSTETYQDKKITITNIGELDLVIDDIHFANDNEGVFSVVELTDNPDLLPLIINASENKELTIRFTPFQRTSYSGELIFRSNAFNDSTLNISLYGIGDAPTGLVSYNKVFINFPNTHVGQSSDIILTAENFGDGAFDIVEIVVEDNDDNVFTFPGVELPLTVDAGASRDITLKFTPKEEIRYNRQMTIYSTALNEPDKIFSARGKGLEPEFVKNEYIDDNYEIKIAPNPVDAKFNISVLSKISSPILIKISEITGKELMTIYDGYINGNIKLNKNMNSLSSGMYIVTFDFKDKIISLPVIKN